MIPISNRTQKPKKTAQELVAKLRDEKGVRFELMNEADAENYLSNKNNYLRTASYRKNYDKHRSGELEGKYINLEFAYLTELSTLDMALRSYILPMCIDIEHAMKVKVVSAIEANPSLKTAIASSMSFWRNTPIFVAASKRRPTQYSLVN